jgi:hypothetical protein
LKDVLYQWEGVARSPLPAEKCVAMKLLIATDGPNIIPDKKRTISFGFGFPFWGGFGFDDD